MNIFTMCESGWSIKFVNTAIIFSFPTISNIQFNFNFFLPIFLPCICSWLLLLFFVPEPRELRNGKHTRCSVLQCGPNYMLQRTPALFRLSKVTPSTVNQRVAILSSRFHISFILSLFHRDFGYHHLFNKFLSTLLIFFHYHFYCFRLLYNLLLHFVCHTVLRHIVHLAFTKPNHTFHCHCYLH